MRAVVRSVRSRGTETDPIRVTLGGLFWGERVVAELLCEENSRLVCYSRIRVGEHQSEDYFLLGSLGVDLMFQESADYQQNAFISGDWVGGIRFPVTGEFVYVGPWRDRLGRGVAAENITGYEIGFFPAPESPERTIDQQLLRMTREQEEWVRKRFGEMIHESLTLGALWSSEGAGRRAEQCLEMAFSEFNRVGPGGSRAKQPERLEPVDYHRIRFRSLTKGPVK